MEYPDEFDPNATLRAGQPSIPGMGSLFDELSQGARRGANSRTGSICGRVWGAAVQDTFLAGREATTRGKMSLYGPGLPTWRSSDVAISLW
jgi:hypothetical protein